MSSVRIARLNEQFKREISELIRVRVRDHRVGVVTVTAVEVARDLGSARVYVRTLGGDSDAEETLQGLLAAAPFMRGELGRILRLRSIPELRFLIDRSMEHARRIEEVLQEVDIPDEVPEDEEADPDAPDSEASSERPGTETSPEGSTEA